MTKEEIKNKLTKQWQMQIFMERPKFGNGMFFTEFDKETNKTWYCYEGIDKYGKGYVNIYDTDEECYKAEMKFIPIIDSYIISRIKQNLHNIKCNIKYFFQKTKKGYCDKDLWSISNWFLSVFPKMLRELKMKPAYMPTDKDGNVINSFVYDERIGEYEDWQNILENIASEFDKANNDDRCPYDCIQEKEEFDKWVEEHNKYIKTHLKTGFDMLYKYFYNLGW